jgi:hypothetical protein
MILLYLDPGAGTVIVQIVVASIASVVVYYKQLRTVISNIFRGRFKKKRD